MRGVCNTRGVGEEETNGVEESFVNRAHFHR